MFAFPGCGGGTTAGRRSWCSASTRRDGWRPRAGTFGTRPVKSITGSPFAPRKDVLSRSERRHCNLLLNHALRASCSRLHWARAPNPPIAKRKRLNRLSTAVWNHCLGSQRRVYQVSDRWRCVLAPLFYFHVNLTNERWETPHWFFGGVVGRGRSAAASLGLGGSCRVARSGCLTAKMSVVTRIVAGEADQSAP